MCRPRSHSPTRLTVDVMSLFSLQFNRRQDKSTLSDDEEDAPLPSRSAASSKPQSKQVEDDDDDDIFDL